MTIWYDSSVAVTMAALTNLQNGMTALLQAFSANKNGLMDKTTEVARLLALKANTKSTTPASSVHITGMGLSQDIAGIAAAILKRAYIKANNVILGNLGHGEITQMQKDDIVFLISRSGETSETVLAQKMIAQAGCICIAVTEKAGSTLARRCDKSLILPEVSEAIPGSRMPTTSINNTGSLFMVMSGIITNINDNNYHADGAHPDGMTQNPDFKLPVSGLKL